MKNEYFKNDEICKICWRSNAINYHKCTFIIGFGTKILYPAKSGRNYLLKDGKTCKYFIHMKERKNNEL